MNATAIETLERRLKATRDAYAGELDRARNATMQAEKARERAAEHLQVIADLTEALDEARGWAPAETGARVFTPPFDVPCPSCGALAGKDCRSPNGDLVEPHATRGAPS